MARFHRSIALTLVLGGVLSTTASAQLIQGGQQGGQQGNVDRNAGLTQSGQVEASGAVSRAIETFVGSATGGVSHPLSIAAAGGQDGLTNFGSIPGFNPNGSANALGGTTGGIGGFGGGGGIGGIGGIGGGGGFGGGGIGGGGFQNFGNAGVGGGNLGTTQAVVPTRLVIGYRYTRTGSTVIANRLSERFVQIPAFKSVVKIAVVMDGDTAVLSGTAPSDHQRMLVERVAMLEPGVNAVRNQVRVVGVPVENPEDGQ